MYKKTIKLHHHETPYAIDKLTGEHREIKMGVNNIPIGKQKFDFDESFHKAYEKVWLYLVDNLSDKEIKVALMMSCMTEYETNSLAPLDDNTSYQMIADKFNLSKSNVKKIFKNLFDIGVYASFKYSHYKRGTVEEWVFNPFISFKGKLINSDLKNLFLNTKVAKHFYDSI